MQIAFFLLLTAFHQCSGDETSFVHTPFNITQMTGENITIPCIVHASEDVECHWLLNSHLVFPSANKYSFNRLSSNGDCSIKISNLNMKEDDGKWECQVYLKQLYIAPAVRVTILMPPEKPKILYKQSVPEDGKIMVKANETTQLECLSTGGNPVPELNWILSGLMVEENKSFKNISTGFIKSTLTYMFDKTMNGARLVCDSRHQLVNEFDSVELDVVYKPEVRIDEDVITVEEGSDLRNIFCHVEANPIAKIKWIDTMNPKILYSDYKELRLTNINKEQNNRVFECFAENEIGRSNIDSFKLNVLYEPRILSESDNQRVQLGNSVSLECKIDSNPEPTINWYHLSVLTGDLKKVAQSESTDQSILLIKNVTYSDEGDYYCEGSNKINDQVKLVRSRDINIKVTGPPALLKDKETEDGNLEGRSVIDLEFCSDPIPTMVYWKASSCRLVSPNIPDESDQNDQRTEGSCQRYSTALRLMRNQVFKENDQSSSNCYRATLIINETKMEDQINYELVVENRLGKMEHSIKLNVNSPISLILLVILVLITFILLLAIGFLVIVVLRRKHKGSENMNDDVLKEEAQIAISHKGDLENGGSKTDFNQLNLNTSNDSYELVYANLDFPPREQTNEQLLQSNNLNLQQQQLLQQKPVGQTKPMQMKFDLPTANKRVPPQVRPKPQIRPQPRQTNGSTEYAKLTFNKADL